MRKLLNFVIFYSTLIFHCIAGKKNHENHERGTCYYSSYQKKLECPMRVHKNAMLFTDTMMIYKKVETGGRIEQIVNKDAVIKYKHGDRRRKTDIRQRLIA